MSNSPIAIRLIDGTELFASSVEQSDNPNIAIIHNPIQLIKYVDESSTMISGASFMDYSNSNFVAIQDANISCITSLNKEYTQFYRNTIKRLYENKSHTFKHDESISFIHLSNGTVQ